MDLASDSLAKRQSILIMAMRFPLIVLVVLVHSPTTISQLSLSLDGWNIYNYVTELVSYNFCKLAVCWFFVFAGYFFFLNLPEDGMTWKWLKDKWSRRVFTLVIPYIIWNLIAVFLPFIKVYIFNQIGIPQSDLNGELTLYNQGFLEWFITGTANFPLWFMRNLIIMNLLTPLLYVIFKNLSRNMGMVVMTVLFLLPFDPEALRWQAFFFFSLGSFFAIHQYNFLSVCRKVRWPSAIAMLIILPICAFWNQSPLHDWLLRLLFPFSMITFMNIIDQIIDNEKALTWLNNMSATVFFIYASHTIYIMPWTKGLLLRLFGDSLAGAWASWLLFPVIVIPVCLGLFYLLRAIMPRTLAFICGGRSKKVVSA